MIKVVVAGASGRMGREVVKAVWQDSEMELVAAVDNKFVERDAGLLAGLEPIGLPVTAGLEKALQETLPDVLVDFTNPQSMLGNIRLALGYKVAVVVGTTGLNSVEIAEIGDLATKLQTGCLIAPNFAIGAILMMKFAQEATRYFPHVEIIELHHDQKLDAPSGTAIKTAELIARERDIMRQGNINEYEKIPGARGGEFEGMRIHSVRLPGLVAHQEVIFGGLGQTLTLRHDSLSRESFMPGVLLGIKRVINIKGVVYGLENILLEA